MPVIGDPAAGVSIPVVVFKLKTETLLSSWLPTNTRLAIGATATPVGREPVVNGEPGTGVSMPVLVFTENTESEFAL